MRRGLWIPWEIWTREGLTMPQRIALAEVHSFDQQGRACFATNAHFARLLHMTESGARKVLAQLVAGGHLIREVQQDAQGAPVRTLRPGSGTCPPRDTCPVEDTRPVEGTGVTLAGQTPDPGGAHITTQRKTETTQKAPKPENLQEVVAAFKEMGAETEAGKFWDHYEANGWTQGRGGRPIRDWRAAARGWIRRAPQFAKNDRRQFDPRNIDPAALRRWADQ